MNVQLYWYDRNFEVQKAERFFKERKIVYQSLDLHRHRLGKREIQLFIRGFGLQELLDRRSQAVLSHPAAYTDDPERVTDYLLERPDLLKLPIIRIDQNLISGYDETKLKAFFKS